MTIMILPILLPVNYTASSSSIRGLDKLSIANIQVGQSVRCWVTVLVAVIVDFHLLRLLLVEFRTVLQIRQSYFHHPSRTEAVTTVLITEIPPRMWKRAFLKRVYSRYNGGPIDIIFPKEDICNIKEIELSNLLKQLEHARQIPSDGDGRQGVASTFGKAIAKTRSQLYLKYRIHKLGKEIKDIKSVAIFYFPNLLTAHLVLQARASSAPLKMNAIAIDNEASNESCLYQNWRMKALRTMGITAILNALAIFWAIPISMTGLLSQLVYLDAISSSPKGLSDRQLSAIQGLAPQAALSILMYCFPLIIRFLMKCYPTFEHSKIEVLIQRYYFVFLYVQVFLVVSISSSVTTMMPEILSDVQSVPSILARNLPKASNYFYSYLLLQAVTQCVMVLFQLPESLWTCLIRGKKRLFPKPVQWSFVYPVFTNLICICTRPVNSPTCEVSAKRKQSRHHILSYLTTHITDRNDHVWAFPDGSFLPGYLCPRNEQRHCWPVVLGGSKSPICGNLHYEFIPSRAFHFTERSWAHSYCCFSYCWGRTGTKLRPKEFPSSHEICICR